MQYWHMYCRVESCRVQYLHMYCRVRLLLSVVLAHVKVDSGEPRTFWGARGGGGDARNFFQVVQQIQLRTEGRENMDLGALAP
jgi:hypothetical protein